MGEIEFASDESIITLAILTAAALIVIVWLLVVGLISRVGGWHRLAAVYRLPGHISLSAGKTFSFQSLRLSLFANYNFIMSVIVNAHGIVLKPLVLYRFMHPPLFIPWERIRNIAYGSMVFRFAAIELAERTITITGKAAAEIERVSPAGSWR